jgi:GAF domain-containing protein
MAMTDSFGSSSREHALAETFVMLADTLVDDYDVVELLDRLVQACVELLGVTAAGLLLIDQEGGLAVVASSSEEMRLLEIFQLQQNEGPCLNCIQFGRPVTTPDLSAEKQRWPVFVEAALSAGFGTVAAMPLRLRETTIGGLNLFSAPGRVLGEADQRVAQALADVATIGILQQRSAHRTSLLAEQLQSALNSRVAIEQAKGVLAERHGLGFDAAFAVLRAHARDHNLKLKDVAVGVVRGEIDPATTV